MGQCYAHEQLGMGEAAIRCYQRAHDSDDREGAFTGSPPVHCDLPCESISGFSLSGRVHGVALIMLSTESAALRTAGVRCWYPPVHLGREM